MAEDIKKVPEPIEDNELDSVSGGVFEPTNWFCPFCGKTIYVTKESELSGHMKNDCPKSPIYIKK